MTQPAAMHEARERPAPEAVRGLVGRLVEDFGEEAADIPAVGTIIGPLAPMLVNALAGVVAGAVAFAIVAAIKRLRARGAAAT